MKQWVKTKEVISQMKEKGYSIEYRKRTDGGYLITSINGVKYTGAKGNNEARSILGEQLPSNLVRARKTVTKQRERKYKVINKTLQKQITQTNKELKKWGVKKPYKNRKEVLKEINTKGIKAVKNTLKEAKASVKVTDALEKQFKRTQRAWNKNKNIKGKITRKVTLNVIKSAGTNETKAKLKRMERYAKGYANNKTITYFIERLNLINKSKGSGIMNRVITFTKKNAYRIKDNAIMDAYQIIYTIANGTTEVTETVIDKIIATLSQF